MQIIHYFIMNIYYFIMADVVLINKEKKGKDIGKRNISSNRLALNKKIKHIFHNFKKNFPMIYIYNQGSRNTLAQSPLATYIFKLAITVGSKIIRSLAIIHVIKLIPYAVL